MAMLGIAALNPTYGLYPELLAEAADDYARPLQLLAKSLAFEDPVSGEPRRFESLRTL